MQNLYVEASLHKCLQARYLIDALICHVKICVSVCVVWFFFFFVLCFVCITYRLEDFYSFFPVRVVRVEMVFIIFI